MSERIYNDDGTAIDWEDKAKAKGGDMSEDELEAILYRALLEQIDEVDADRFSSVLPYWEAGMMTRNKGLVVSTFSGDEFQITIVRSR